MLGRRLVVASLVWLLWPATAAAATFTKQDMKVRMTDGVEIAATLYLPDGAQPFAGWPAVILAHGLGGTRASMAPIAEENLAPNGYAVLAYDARAHGESGGLYSVDGPREVADLQELFTWLAARPDVDDTHIGGLGISYGGGSLWQAAAQGTPFAAIEPIITFSDLRAALLPQGFPKTGVVFQLSQAVPEARWAPGLPQLRADALALRNLPAAYAFADERSALPKLASVRIPTFMIHGRQDFLFDMDQALRAYAVLKGPKRMYFGTLGHPPAKNFAAEEQYYFEEAKQWFDRFLKGVDNGVEKRRPVELAPDPWRQKTTSFAARPAVRASTFAAPSAKRSLTSVGAMKVTFPRTTKLMETFGAGTVRVQASTRTSYPHLVAVLSAKARDGRELVVSEGGVLTPSLTRTPRAVTIKLMSVAVAIPKGSRLTLTIASTSTAQHPQNLLYITGVPDGSTITLTRPRLTLPTLKTPVSR